MLLGIILYHKYLALIAIQTFLQYKQKYYKTLKKGTYTLTNVAYRIGQNERYSDWWDSDNNCNTTSQKDLSMIDHVLVTSKIDKQIMNIYIYHGYKEYCGKWDSDHYPVVIDFKF